MNVMIRIKETKVADDEAEKIRDVKSKLFPLSKRTLFLEKLIEWLPRAFINVRLDKRHEIDVIKEEKGEFRSTGNTPTFEMLFDTPKISRGWYYLEGAITRHSGNRTAYIQIELEDKHSSAYSIVIPSNLRGSIGEVLYIPGNVKNIYWIPMAALGYFSQSAFLLHKISFIESYLRRLYRVIYDCRRLNKSTSVAAQFGFIVRAVFDIKNAYKKSADARISWQASPHYSEFIKYNDALKKSETSKIKKELSQFRSLPLITIVMPVHPSKISFINDAINSVVLQTYEGWELLLVGDFSKQTSQTIFPESLQKNYRVKIIDAGQEKNLAQLFNTALDVAQGEYILRLENDAVLEMNALAWLVKEINMHRDTDLIYSDEDCIDEKNQRFDPKFKPDWNPDLLFSIPYIGNLTLWKSKTVRSLNGYNSELDAAYEYDLILRYYKHSPETKIRHIEKILYHTRSVKNDDLHQAVIPKELHYAAAQRALENYFSGSNVIVKRNSIHPGVYHIHYPLPDNPPLVSIIIPTRDKVEILKTCIQSIESKTDYKNWEIIIVNNQSQDPETYAYFDTLQRRSEIRILLYNEPYNYSAINNLAARHANGEVLALINNDIEVIASEWLSELVSNAMRPDIGVVGPKLLYPNGMVQHAGVVLGIGGVSGHVHKYLGDNDVGYCYRAVTTQNFSALTGACMVVRKSVYEKVGGMDDIHLPVAFNDIDFCLKVMQTGLRNIYISHVKLFHHESLTRGADDTPEKIEVFKRESLYMKQKWAALLSRDPAYNPNLTLLSSDLSLSSRFFLQA